jgi:hypothetical protein
MSYGGRYRRVLPDGRLGQLVSRAEIVGGLRTLNANSARLLADLAEDVVAGYLLPQDFEQAAMLTLRNLYNANSALARGGWLQMDAAAWGRNGQILRGEYAFLRRFTQELADGNLTAAQARARAALYIGKAYSRFWAEDQLMQVKWGKTEELWEDTQGPNECSVCPELAAMGWVPIGAHGTVPGAGGTPCLGNCECGLQYR